MRRSTARLLVCAVAITLAGCGSHKTRRDGPGSGRIPELPGDAVPRQEPRSKYGNGPRYEVRNKTYTVMQSSEGYRERGVASWYGNKFHGNLTSNREVYNMYAMTAAHKTLPLPSYVRVRNLRNDKSVVVRVNDRGPFANNRIIDLSYAAALKLDMVRAGTSLVEVTAISSAKPQGEQPTSSRRPPQAVIASTPTSTSTSTPSQIFVQVGAYGDRGNAVRRLAFLSRSGIDGGFVYEDRSIDASLYRVRIGPIADVIQYDILVEELEVLGITDPYLITE